MITADKKILSDYKTFEENPSVVTVGDDNKYIKLYVTAIEEMANLSTPGMKVYCYILIRLQAGENEVTINLRECVEMCQYTSTVSIYKGLAELLEGNMIFRKVGHASTFFINVNYFYSTTR